MKKLHRVNDSKIPTLDQLTRMVQNLQIKYPGSYTTVELQCSGYRSGDFKIEYWISVEGVYKNFVPTWDETLIRYRKLMKGVSNV